MSDENVENKPQAKRGTRKFLLALAGVGVLATAYFLNQERINDFLTVDTGEAAIGLMERVHAEPNPAAYSQELAETVETIVYALPKETKELTLSRIIERQDEEFREEVVLSNAYAMDDSVRSGLVDRIYCSLNDTIRTRTVRNLIGYESMDEQRSIMVETYGAQDDSSKFDFVADQVRGLDYGRTQQVFEMTGTKVGKDALHKAADYLSENFDKLKQMMENKGEQ